MDDSSFHDHRWTPVDEARGAGPKVARVGALAQRAGHVAVHGAVTDVAHRLVHLGAHALRLCRDEGYKSDLQ